MFREVEIMFARIVSLAGWSGLLVYLTLCQGCATNPDGFELKGFDSEQISQIQAAADEWCEATDGACCPTLRGGESKMVATDSPLGGGAGATLHGPDGESTITMLPLSGDAMRLLALHELGHHCGCRDDYKHRSNVMWYQTDTTATNLTDTDAACGSK